MVFTRPLILTIFHICLATSVFLNLEELDKPVNQSKL